MGQSLGEYLVGLEVEEMRQLKKRKPLSHTSHCCVVCGCKYGDERCPVVTQQEKQDGHCESCNEDTIIDPKDPNFDVEFMGENQLRAEVIRLREALKPTRV